MMIIRLMLIKWLSWSIISISEQKYRIEFFSFRYWILFLQLPSNFIFLRFLSQYMKIHKFLFHPFFQQNEWIINRITFLCPPHLFQNESRRKKIEKNIFLTLKSCRQQRKQKNKDVKKQKLTLVEALNFFYWKRTIRKSL